LRGEVVFELIELEAVRFDVQTQGVNCSPTFAVPEILGLFVFAGASALAIATQATAATDAATIPPSARRHQPRQ
jgi:hypothetical protein